MLWWTALYNVIELTTLYIPIKFHLSQVFYNRINLLDNYSFVYIFYSDHSGSVLLDSWTPVPNCIHLSITLCWWHHLLGKIDLYSLGISLACKYIFNIHSIQIKLIINFLSADIYNNRFAVNVNETVLQPHI